MKVLVLLPDSPAPWSNTAARYYGPMLKALAGLGHDVTALAIKRPGTNGMAYFQGSGIRFRLFDPPRARPLVERKLRSLWRSGWELAVSDFGRAARAEAGEDYDLILGEMPEAARVLEDDPRTVLSLHHFRFEDLAPLDDEAPPGQRLERIQARRAELSTCQRVGHIRTTSTRLEQLSRRHGIKAPIEIVPICLDRSLYRPLPAPPVPTVGVLGSMFWAPSRRAARHFIERIVPWVRADYPGARFLVGGWQAKRFLADYVTSDDIEILDSFADPAEAFGRMSVLVYAPPIGTGMKVKVLEAMAYGVPVVVNREGFEGLDADRHPPALLAESDDEIIAHVLRLLRDPIARAEVAEEGRWCLERTFSPHVVTQALIEIFHKTIRELR